MLFIFIAYPALIFVVAFLMLVLYLWQKSRAALAAGVIWVCYGIYELLIYARVLCSGECNIRVDLLVLYPLLAMVTAAALIFSCWRFYKKLAEKRDEDLP